VPGHWYSLSTELNPWWSSYFVTQPEILTYWENLYYKYDLHTHTTLNTCVYSAEWDNVAQLYNVVLVDSVTGEHTGTQAEAIIYAIGPFMSPLFPKDLHWAGVFDGLVWHSARWRHDVDLKGKRVGVIGNGCSASVFFLVGGKGLKVALQCSVHA
jgi:cation diffusion facilitator CzcD-associated flavoprotein CzcO